MNESGPSPREDRPYKYWAFISYSHQDNLSTRGDGSGDHIPWASWLHEQLETYRVPDSYRDRTARTGEPMPERFFPIFRDEAELPTSHDLGGKIRDALSLSRFLVVIASPRSARSRYVGEEIRHFRELGRGDRILVLIVDGEPNVRLHPKAGWTAGDDCFCPALIHPLRPDGAVDTDRLLPEEPIAADVRVKAEEPARELRDSEQGQPDHRATLDFMKLKLIAGLMGAGLDELVQRDKLRQLEEAKLRARTLRRWLAAVIALALLATGGGFIAWHQKEKAVRAEHAANSAEHLATLRLGQAESARDAAERLVSEAIFGLREKLVPLGKITVVKDLAAAAEDYYSKLPPELASRTSRRHEVRLALNRAMIAMGSSDDDETEAAANKALKLARELLATAPGDEGLREAQGDALVCLVVLRIGQERWPDAEKTLADLTSLTDEWLKVSPKAPAALRAKLYALCAPLMFQRNAIRNPAVVMPVFSEAQKVLETLREVGGETMETRTASAASLLGRAMLMGKLGQKEAALKLFEEANAAFRTALLADEGHPLIREGMSMSRRWSISQLRALAEERKDAALEKEAYRQTNELLADLTALAEFEPLRLDRWRGVAWLHLDNAAAVRKLEGEAAWQAWIEKGLAAAERAVAPRFERPSVRNARIHLRLALCDALESIRPAGWDEKVFRLLAEAGEIGLASAKGRAVPEDTGQLGFILDHWRSSLIAAASSPGQNARLTEQAHALAAFAQKSIDALPGSGAPRRQAVESIARVAELFERQGRAEAADFTALGKRWRAELEQNFADDPDTIAMGIKAMQDRSSELLETLRAAPQGRKDERLGELEANTGKILAFGEQHRGTLSEHDLAVLRAQAHTTLGTALMELARFADAEAALRGAVAEHTTATAKSASRAEAVQRRWNTAYAQGLLGFSLFRQGREEDGRAMRYAAAETMTEIAKSEPTPGRLRDSGAVWRRTRDVLIAPSDAAERLVVAQKSAELLRESVRLAKTIKGFAVAETAKCLTEAASAEYELALEQKALQHFKEALVAGQRALDFSHEAASSAAPANVVTRLSQTGGIRQFMASLLSDLGRAEEAQAQVDAIGTLLQQIDGKPGSDSADVSRLRVWFNDHHHK